MRLIRRGIFSALLALSLAPAPAYALDPLLMLLLGVARDMVISAATSPKIRQEAPQVDPGKVYQGTLVEPGQLRALIDDCFSYLGPAQRREIFNSLNEALLNPKNAAVRAPMIEYFAERALAVRAAHQRLSMLSTQEKRMLAAEFRAETEAMPPEEQKQLSEVLRQGLLPVPSDLNQLLLAALER
jgi:hypothetical protein